MCCAAPKFTSANFQVGKGDPVPALKEFRNLGGDRVTLPNLKVFIRLSCSSVSNKFQKPKGGTDNSTPPSIVPLQSVLSTHDNHQSSHSRNPGGSTAGRAPCYLSANCSPYSRFDNLLRLGTQTDHLGSYPYVLP